MVVYASFFLQNRHYDTDLTAPLNLLSFHQLYLPYGSERSISGLDRLPAGAQAHHGIHDRRDEGLARLCSRQDLPAQVRYL